jgi:hypothetical protein
MPGYLLTPKDMGVVAWTFNPAYSSSTSGTAVSNNSAEIHRIRCLNGGIVTSIRWIQVNTPTTATGLYWAIYTDDGTQRLGMTDNLAADAVNLGPRQCVYPFQSPFTLESDTRYRILIVWRSTASTYSVTGPIAAATNQVFMTSSSISSDKHVLAWFSANMITPPTSLNFNNFGSSNPLKLVILS